MPGEWVEGTCPRCGRLWRRRGPAGSIICDCHLYCPICGERMEPYHPDLDPLIYRSEDVLDPTGMASKSEATIRTRFRCPRCGELSDGIPVEVKLS